MDVFDDLTDTVAAPARAPFPIVPSDTVAIAVLPKAIYVGTGGTVVLRGIDAAADVSFVNVASGQTIDVRASHVRATGTTAANLIGLA
jgi:hypothetical protein